MWAESGAAHEVTRMASIINQFISRWGGGETGSMYMQRAKRYIGTLANIYRRFSRRCRLGLNYRANLSK